MVLVNGSTSMAHIYMRAIPVSSIARSKTSGEDRTKQIKELIREALKLERMIITKNPSSNSIDKERVLQNIRKNIVSLSETMFTKKALMLAIPMLFLI